MAGIRPAWIGVGLIIVLVVTGTWALRDGDSGQQDHGRLQPLMPLTRGVWYERGEAENEWLSRTVYEWALDGELLLEHVVDPSSGATLREGRFFWHGGKQELGYQAQLPGGELREGILRAIEDGLELRYNAFQPDGTTVSHRVRIRFLADGGAVWTAHRQTGDAEILDHESSFVRKNR